MPVSDGSRDEILKLLDGPPALWSPGAISYELRRPPGGPLGETPDPEIAEALRKLWAAGRIVRVEVCPGCGAPGELFGLPRARELDLAGTRGTTVEELSEAMAPLIAEGAVELSEHVEIVENPCCKRTARLWRDPPLPI
jgi:hypothetical protein